ncbi:hypothetical protein B0H63DRAFT_281825 [Podospora didyma]|uniref:Uncharacterized protein n=1 Tax=Podospora didyma TaxID=330526 RepID=A0AAE0K9H8_9PEZI|nr:hypothetical protein B0H63DRAFT_281825 [Podospora didyma]
MNNWTLTSRNPKLHNYITSPTNHRMSESTAISSTSASFQAQLARNGVRSYMASEKSPNYEELVRHLNEPCGSLPEDLYRKYEDYKSCFHAATNEQAVFRLVNQVVQLPTGKPFGALCDWPSDGLPANVGFNDGLASPKPEYVEGLSATVFDQDLLGQIPGAILAGENKTRHFHHLSSYGRGIQEHEWKVNNGQMSSGLRWCRSGLGKGNGLKHPKKSDGSRAYVMKLVTNGDTVEIFGHFCTSFLVNGKEKVIFHMAMLGWDRAGTDFESFKRCLNMVAQA